MSTKESCIHRMKPVHERWVLQSVKLEGKGHLMPLTLHIELYDLAFALVVLRLALAQYILTIPPFLSFRK